jgi:DNA-binding response OmpR family regulator
MASSAKSSCRFDRHQKTWTAIESAPAPLQGARVLVVDDEFLIAAQLEADLSAAGAEVIGPLLTVSEALAAAAREDLTAAVLDIQIGSDSIGAVALELSARGIPFVFYTGQVHTDPIRAQWPMCRVVSKPAPAHRLIAEVAAVMETGSRTSSA